MDIPKTRIQLPIDQVCWWTIIINAITLGLGTIAISGVSPTTAFTISGLAFMPQAQIM